MMIGMYIKAFIIGGLFCAIAQIFIDKTKLTPARILVSYVCIGVVLTVIGVYEPLVNFAGAGATVPIIGFGYTLGKGVLKGIAENGLLGAITGGVTASAGGIAASIFFGYLIALICKPKAK